MLPNNEPRIGLLAHPRIVGQTTGLDGDSGSSTSKVNLA